MKLFQVELTSYLLIDAETEEDAEAVLKGVQEELETSYKHMDIEIETVALREI